MPPVKEGEEYLTRIWFEALDALQEIMMHSDDVMARVGAADALLKYSATFGTGIHDPFLPTKRPAIEEDEDE